MPVRSGLVQFTSRLLQSEAVNPVTESPQLVLTKLQACTRTSALSRLGGGGPLPSRKQRHGPCATTYGSSGISSTSAQPLVIRTATVAQKPTLERSACTLT